MNLFYLDDMAQVENNALTSLILDPNRDPKKAAEAYRRVSSWCEHGKISKKMQQVLRESLQKATEAFGYDKARAD